MDVYVCVCVFVCVCVRVCVCVKACMHLWMDGDVYMRIQVHRKKDR